MNHREENVLVYEHRAGDYGRESVFTMTRGELDHTLVRNPHLQTTTKPINHQYRLEIYQTDLYTDNQLARYGGMPNANVNIASIKIGLCRFWRYTELIILSENKD